MKANTKSFCRFCGAPILFMKEEYMGYKDYPIRFIAVDYSTDYDWDYTLRPYHKIHFQTCYGYIKHKQGETKCK